MQIVTQQKYKGKLEHEPWHDTLGEVMNSFKMSRHADITAESGFANILASDEASRQYNDAIIGSLMGNAPEETRENVAAVMAHSMADVRSNHQMAVEGADAMANNANYNSLAKLNAWVIAGYTARAKALELFHTFTHDDPTISFRFVLDYTVKGNDPKKYFHPQADRDGDLADLYELPQLEPKDDPTFLTSSVNSDGHLELDTNTESTLQSGNQVWIKIAGGVRGNAFVDAGGKWDATKYTLGMNPTITGIKFSVPNPADANAPFEGSMTVYNERHRGEGYQSQVKFGDQIQIPYDDGTKFTTGTVVGNLDLDTGDYEFAAIGPITAIQLDLRLTNVANEMGTNRSGSLIYQESFSVDNHPYGTVPVVPEMSDDFNAGGEGVSAVAYYTDKVTQTFANSRDQLMERKLDEAYLRPTESYKLFPKLGGWKGNLTFPLTARLAGGSDPYSWMRTGLKTTVVNHLTRGETDLYFEDDKPRQWYLFGHEIDMNLFPDITFSTWNGEATTTAATQRYGFNTNDNTGYVSSDGRRVRIISSVYKRHLGKNGKRIPIRAVLKSMDLEQPTTLYLPYSFRVYSGIMPEYTNRTGLIVAARDCIKVMLQAQSRITLKGNTDNLYNDIVQNNQPVGVQFPEGATRVQIEAGN